MRLHNNFLKSAGITLMAWLTAACGARDNNIEGREHPEWSYDAVIYELNTRQFTPEGTFEAARAHLPRLKELGVKIIWFMPIHPIGELERKGTLGSYYAISDYKAINPEFGTLEDFQQFVDEAHSMGFKVIIDWVANHTSPDALWTTNRDWYVLNEKGDFLIQYDWTDIAKLDYSNEEMRAAMIDAMAYWLRQTGIDGFRCDVAGEVPTDFWESAVDTLQTIKPDLFMLAEAEKPELNNNAFDMYYAWELHKLMNEVAQGKKNVVDLRGYLKTHDRQFPKNAIPMVFTSNHDENSWNGSEFERMGEGAQTFAVLSYLVPGMPLIYNGQEVGFDHRLEFFEKDSISWEDRGGFTELYTRLNALKRENRALWCTPMGGPVDTLRSGNTDKVLAFAREVDGNRVVALFNLSGDAVSGTLHLDKYEGLYKEYFTEQSVTLSKSYQYELSPWEYYVYRQ